MISLSSTSSLPVQIGRLADRVSSSLERLSSGLRINRASDDAGRLAVSETMRTQARGTAMAMKNIQDAINIVHIGEDGVQALFPIMQRIRELVLEAKNGTNTDADRTGLQAEIDAIKQAFADCYVEATNARVNYDGTPADRQLDFQVGANRGDSIRVDFNGLRNALGGLIIAAFGYQELYNSPFIGFISARFGAPPPLPTALIPAGGIPGFGVFPPGTTYQQAFPKLLNVVPGTSANLTTSLSLIDTYLPKLEKEASYLGAQVNRLEHILAQVSSTNVEMNAAESRIRDADLAAESIDLAREQVLQQGAVSLLGQANAHVAIIKQLLERRP